jgi:hypothetical protein
MAVGKTDYMAKARRTGSGLGAIPLFVVALELM